MYDPQLEKLITMALNDGVITEKERQILLKKAVEFGIDPDDFEMDIEFRLGKLTPQSNSVMNVGNDNVVKTVINASSETNGGQPNSGRPIMNIGNDNVVTAHIDASNKVNIASQTIINQNKEKIGTEYIKLLTSGEHLKLNDQVIKQMINNFPSEFSSLPEILDVLTETYAYISGHWIKYFSTKHLDGLSDSIEYLERQSVPFDCQHFIKSINLNMDSSEVKINFVINAVGFAEEILKKIRTVVAPRADKNILDCLKKIDDMISTNTFLLTLSDSLFYALVSLNENNIYFQELVNDFKKYTIPLAQN